MSDSPEPDRAVSNDPIPPQPGVAIVPGMLFVIVGGAMIGDGELATLGWILAIIGLAFFLVGAIAMGVRWGLALHAESLRNP